MESMFQYAHKIGLLSSCAHTEQQLTDLNWLVGTIKLLDKPMTYPLLSVAAYDSVSTEKAERLTIAYVLGVYADLPDCLTEDAFIGCVNFELDYMTADREAFTLGKRSWDRYQSEKGSEWQEY